MFKPGNGRLSGKPTKSPLSNCPEVVPNVPSGPRYLRIWPPVGATIGLLRLTIVEIHLQYLPDAVLFPERGSQAAFLAEESRKLALPVRLPAHGSFECRLPLFNSPFDTDIASRVYSF